MSNLDWDLDNAMVCLKAAISAKHKGEQKEALTHLNNVIYEVKEAIERLEKGEE